MTASPADASRASDVPRLVLDRTPPLSADAPPLDAEQRRVVAAHAGALGDDNDTYTNKVLGEKQRLQQVVAALAEPAPAAPRLGDAITALPMYELGMPSYCTRMPSARTAADTHVLTAGHGPGRHVVRARLRDTDAPQELPPAHRDEGLGDLQRRETQTV
mgnify:CR=1 FL=1